MLGERDQKENYRFKSSIMLIIVTHLLPIIIRSLRELPRDRVEIYDVRVSLY